MMTDRPASDADAETKHAQAGIAFSNSSVTLVLSELSLAPIPPAISRLLAYSVH